MMGSDRSLSNEKWMRKIMGNVGGRVAGAVAAEEAEEDSPRSKPARAARIAALGEAFFGILKRPNS